MIRKPYNDAELRSLAAIWKRAVEATHHFLTPSDIAGYEPRVRNDYLPRVEVWVAVDETDIPVGFIGLAGSKIEMLFVDPIAHGGGFGSALVDAVAAHHDTLTVDVNEQNPDAHEWYLRRGFEQTGRSTEDSDGRPFPLLHLRRTN
ncbi:acetyltransferase [Antrihabitans sp. YC2-6]|nr:acetyltransferase [Antrihabitans sp. YC2-6]